MKSRLRYQSNLWVIVSVLSGAITFMSCRSSTTPTPSVTDQSLYGIWGTAQERWAVGEKGTLLHYVQSVGEWTPSLQSMVLTQDGLGEVWGLNEKEVWAVGRSQDGTGSIFHYDGIQWTRVYKDSSDKSGLIGVWASSSTDVWVVGQGGSLIHYDGNKWARVSSGVTFNLYSIWGSSAQDVWAVGGNDQDSGNIANMIHYDGKNWQVVFSSTDVTLSGIWGISGNDIWALGGDEHSRNATLIHFNGVGWKTISLNISFLNPVGFSKIWGTSDQDIWILGYYHYTGPDTIKGFGGITFHFDGMMWESISVPSQGVLHDISGSSTNDVWLVGEAGALLKWDIQLHQWTY